ncbi:MAG: NAD-dependent epimerase/dehydratase family protein [Gemmatimonadota bacterium]
MSTSGGEGTILFGGSGFMGPYILRQHPAMVSVGRTPPPTENLHVQVDRLADLRALRDLEFDKVIYIVGNTDHHALERETLSRGEPTAFDYHVVPFLQTMEQIKDRPIRKLMHFSTILIYDEKRLRLPVSEDAPIDPYKNRYVFSKYLAEEACRFYSRWVPIINVRMSNLYGPIALERYDLIHVLIRQLLREGRGEVWSIRPERDFIHVEDAAEGVVRLLETDYEGTLNLGTGIMTSVGEIVTLLEELSGCPINVLDVPVQGPMQFRVDTALVHHLTGWTPGIPVAEGVRNTFEKMRAWLAK